jgi:hypothetical protein
MALNVDAEQVKESLVTLSGISDDALRAAVTARANSPEAGGSDEGTYLVEVTALAGAPDSEAVLQGRRLTPPTISASPAPSPGELLWDKLIAESRARPEQPSRVTILVPCREGH